MEQELSGRLLKYLSHIKEMVDYLEVSGHLLTSGVMSAADHQNFLGKVYSTGNSQGMEDLVNVLRMRRGGYAAFVNALRANDYNWLADQMGPEPLQKTEDSKGMFHSLLKRRSSRNSDRMSAETVFTTYRQTFPMDLSSSCRSLNHCSSSFSMSPTLTKSFDSLSLNFEEKSDSTTSASALLLNINIPETTPTLKDAEVVSKIAQEINFPLAQCLTSLKRISVQSKTLQKNKSKSKTVNLKIKFKSKEARDRFIEQVNNSCSNLLSFGGALKGVPLDTKEDTGGGTWFKKLLKKR